METSKSRTYLLVTGRHNFPEPSMKPENKTLFFFLFFVFFFLFGFGSFKTGFPFIALAVLELTL